MGLLLLLRLSVVVVSLPLLCATVFPDNSLSGHSAEEDELTAVFEDLERAEDASQYAMRDDDALVSDADQMELEDPIGSYGFDAASRSPKPDTSSFLKNILEKVLPVVLNRFQKFLSSRRSPAAVNFGDVLKKVGKDVATQYLQQLRSSDLAGERSPGFNLGDVLKDVAKGVAVQYLGQLRSPEEFLEAVDALEQDQDSTAYADKRSPRVRFGDVLKDVLRGVAVKYLQQLRSADMDQNAASFDWGELAKDVAVGAIKQLRSSGDLKDLMEDLQSDESQDAAPQTDMDLNAAPFDWGELAKDVAVGAIKQLRSSGDLKDLMEDLQSDENQKAEPQATFMQPPGDWYPRPPFNPPFQQRRPAFPNLPPPRSIPETTPYKFIPRSGLAQRSRTDNEVDHEEVSDQDMEASMDSMGDTGLRYQDTAEDLDEDEDMSFDMAQDEDFQQRSPSFFRSLKKAGKRLLKKAGKGLMKKGIKALTKGATKGLLGSLFKRNPADFDLDALAEPMARAEEIGREANAMGDLGQLKEQARLEQAVDEVNSVQDSSLLDNDEFRSRDGSPLRLPAERDAKSIPKTMIEALIDAAKEGADVLIEALAGSFPFVKEMPEFIPALKKFVHTLLDSLKKNDQIKKRSVDAGVSPDFKKVLIRNTIDNIIDTLLNMLPGQLKSHPVVPSVAKTLKSVLHGALDGLKLKRSADMVDTLNAFALRAANLRGRQGETLRSALLFQGPLLKEMITTGIKFLEKLPFIKENPLISSLLPFAKNFGEKFMDSDAFKRIFNSRSPGFPPPRIQPYPYPTRRASSLPEDAKRSLAMASQSLLKILRGVPEVNANVFMRRVVDIMEDTLRDAIWNDTRLPSYEEYNPRPLLGRSNSTWSPFKLHSSRSARRPWMQRKLMDMCCRKKAREEIGSCVNVRSIDHGRNLIGHLDSLVDIVHSIMEMASGAETDAKAWWKEKRKELCCSRRLGRLHEADDCITRARERG